MDTSYLLTRLLSGFVALVVLSVVVFFLLNVLPGDAALSRSVATGDRDSTERLRANLGLDKPIHERYVDYASDLLRGDLGRSLSTQVPVSQAIGERAKATVELAVLAGFVGITLGVFFGVLAAVHRGRWIDAVVVAVGSIGIAVPTFWVGILLVYLFSLELDLVPAAGYVPLTEDPMESLRLMVLPVATLSFWVMASMMRVTRSAFIEVMNEEFVRTARAKGLPPRIVIVRHTLRAALIPIVTLAGLQLGRIIGGAVIIENVFAIPGLGRLLVDSITSRDYITAEGVVLIIGATVIVINFVVDLSLRAINPSQGHA
ncbi:MAG TPA: ABC transporter permease [Gemmatimonadales bacterium]|nr:ABC transporter permease [Gemmatimonadales bacterium]